MTQKNKNLILLILAMVIATQAFGQTPLPGGTQLPPVWDQPIDANAEPRQGKFLEFGEFRDFYFDFALENDVISQADDNYSHGLFMGLNFQGDWGKWRAGYDTRLWTNDFQLTPTESEKTQFIERTHFDLVYESRPNDEGIYYRFGPGLEVFTDQESVIGGQFQQEVFHPIIGSKEKDYFNGDTREISPTLTAGLGFVARNEDKTLYCRFTSDLQGNTETDRSYLRGMAEAGWSLWNRDDGRPIFEVLGSAQCTQYLENDRDVSFTVNTRLTLPLGTRVNMHINAGVTTPIEEANDIFLYTNDGNAIGLFSISFSAGRGTK
jgi:hypothetical protein